MKFTSRKWLISLATTVLMVGIPILFRREDIGDSVTITSLSTISSISLGYLFANFKTRQLEIGNGAFKKSAE